jgi:hypothetical protein
MLSGKKGNSSIRGLRRLPWTAAEFWSRAWDEARLMLDAYWRNKVWEILFPCAPEGRRGGNRDRDRIMEKTAFIPRVSTQPIWRLISMSPNRCS